MMTYRIEVRMPNAASVARQAFAALAIQKHTKHRLRITFIEPPDYDKERVDVWCHNKGVGVKTREKWTTAVRRALETIR